MEPTTTGFKKPWYKKSENTIGAHVVGLALLGLFTVIGIKVFPFILLAVTNTIYLAGLCAALAAIVFVALDKDVHTAVYYTWKSITRAIGYAIINQDPIGVIETSIKTMKSKLTEMQQSKNDVGGQLRGLQAKIKDNSDRAELA